MKKLYSCKYSFRGVTPGAIFNPNGQGGDEMTDTQQLNDIAEKVLGVWRCCRRLMLKRWRTYMPMKMEEWQWKMLGDSLEDYTRKGC